MIFDQANHYFCDRPQLTNFAAVLQYRLESWACFYTFGFSIPRKIHMDSSVIMRNYFHTQLYHKQKPAFLCGKNDGLLSSYKSVHHPSFFIAPCAQNNSWDVCVLAYLACASINSLRLSSGLSMSPPSNSVVTISAHFLRKSSCDITLLMIHTSWHNYTYFRDLFSFIQHSFSSSKYLPCTTLHTLRMEISYIYIKTIFSSTSLPPLHGQVLFAALP